MALLFGEAARSLPKDFDKLVDGETGSLVIARVRHYTPPGSIQAQKSCGPIAAHGGFRQPGRCFLTKQRFFCILAREGLTRPSGQAV